VHDCIPNKKQETYYLIDNGKNGNHRKDSRGKITSHQFDFEGMAFGISLFYSEAGYAIGIRRHFFGCSSDNSVESHHAEAVGYIHLFDISGRCGIMGLPTRRAHEAVTALTMIMNVDYVLSNSATVINSWSVFRFWKLELRQRVSPVSSEDPSASWYYATRLVLHVQTPTYRPKHRDTAVQWWSKRRNAQANYNALRGFAVTLLVPYRFRHRKNSNSQTGRQHCTLLRNETALLTIFFNPERKY
jgi:hypothetical protein